MDAKKFQYWDPNIGKIAQFYAESKRAWQTKGRFQASYSGFYCTSVFLSTVLINLIKKSINHNDKIICALKLLSSSTDDNIFWWYFREIKPQLQSPQEKSWWTRYVWKVMYWLMKHWRSTLHTGYGIPVGQNLAWGYSSWDEAIQGWFNEVQYFRLGHGTTNPRKGVGHYTQVRHLKSVAGYNLPLFHGKCLHWQHLLFCVHSLPVTS